MSDEEVDRTPNKSRSKQRELRLKRRLVLPPGARELSSIGFPYQDLEAGITVARAILGAGGVPLSRDQLAGVMNQSAGSGAFVTKVATARMFGLIAANNGRYELTGVGFSILDTDERRQKEARATAFLNVPLFRRTYDEFKGKQLPPRPMGLETAFMRFGVASKQTTNARLAFDKSASQAGFFPNGPDRLIEPIITHHFLEARGIGGSDDRSDEGEAITAPTKPDPFVRGLHPFIQGLLDTLPAPQSDWSEDGRIKWLQAAANIFDLMYKGGAGGIEITSGVDKGGSE